MNEQSTKMKHVLFDIWEVPGQELAQPWRAQMVNFIGHFSTKVHAEEYVKAVRDFRRKNGIKPC